WALWTWMWTPPVELPSITRSVRPGLTGSGWRAAPDGKNTPFRSCPTWAKKFNGAVTPLTPGTSGTLVEKFPGLEVKLKPESLWADQFMVAWFSLNDPAKPFAVSLTVTCRVTGPSQTTSKEIVEAK